MASTISIVVSILLMFSYITTTLTLSARPWPMIKATNDMLSNVCSQTNNPPFCLQALKSDPRTANADLRGLAQVSVDLARASAEQTFKFVGLLAKQETDPKLKKRYAWCSGNYDRATVYVEEAKGSLSSGDYQSMSVLGASAMSEVDDCEEQFRKPPVDPSGLPERNRNLFDLSSMVAEIALLL